jgi:fatty-acid peroxygenase
MPIVNTKPSVLAGHHDLPKDPSIDSTLALLREGYNFIPNRCRDLKTDIFETRLMLKKAICIQGEEASKIFYGGHRFTRKGALPLTTVKLLQDIGSVQSLDGEKHHQRKHMFLSLLLPTEVERLVDIAKEEWRLAAVRWEKEKSIVLHSAVQEVLTRAVCIWAGLPLSDRELQFRTQEFSSMVDGAGANVSKKFWNQALQIRSENWAQKIIENIREKKFTMAPELPAYIIATHKEPDGTILSTEHAAVELINLLRPTVAVARFITYGALALYEHPDYRQKFHEDKFAEHFINEVRRFYPYFPFIGGKVIQEFDWRGHHFNLGEWVIFDIYGTNHDPRIWKDPFSFNPSRFEDFDGNEYTFVPQGGGLPLKSHRCPGERLTVELMKMALKIMAFEMTYTVPEQNFKISLSKMPAIPESGFIITDVGMIGA